MDVIEKTLTKKEPDSEAMKTFGFRLRNQFNTNKVNRRAKELEWLENLRQYKGLYDPDVKIDVNNSKVYPRLTRSKVNIVLSRLHEMLFPETDRNWELSPTPEPEIPKSQVMEIAASLVKTDEAGASILPTADELALAIQKHAKETCSRMANEIDDQFTEMEYPEETKKVLRSGLMYGTGIMKGPLIASRIMRKWKPVKEKGDYEEISEKADRPVLKFTRIWDWYPDMSCVDLDKIEGSFERHIMTKHDLRQLMKRKDFFGSAIKGFLETHRDGNYVPLNWEVELQTIEVEAGSGKSGTSTSISATTGDSDSLSDDFSETTRSTYRQHGKKYEVLEYWGYIDGEDLAACGVEVEDVMLEYEANIWLIGPTIIKVALYEKALDEYKVFYYEKDETSIFGEGLARVMRHSQIAIAAAARMVLDNAACVAGDTQVYRNQTSSSPTSKRPSIVTVKELWESKEKFKSGLRRSKIRCVNEETGEIYYNKIIDVFNNGIRPVFLVKTAHGYFIKATDDHKFLADDGNWKELGDFCCGDLIAVNGSPKKKTGVCIECGVPTTVCGVRCRRCASKKENSKWNMRQAEQAAEDQNALPSTARQRWACQKDKKEECERCGAKKAAGANLHIHHIDGNPHNNDKTNKLTLCCPCHMYVHNRHAYFGIAHAHKYIDFDEIESIEYVGDEQVFDIQMESPDHNFIANGFVAHNCVAGPQLEINWSLLMPDSDMTSFYPRKLWFREGRGIDASYQAIRPLNFDSHIDELLKIVDAFKQFADEETTLPTWMIGQMVNNETAQATSGRLATITISIKDVVKNFDAFTEKIIRDMYAWNMDFSKRGDIKGDFKCKAKGVASLVMKEIRMQALAQLSTTLTDEERDYIPTRELLKEKMKAHDLNITLLTDEEYRKKIEDRQNSLGTRLAVSMQEAEIGYKKAQTAAQLTKAKKANTEAIKEAQTPPDNVEPTDPRLTEGELALQQADLEAKNADSQRKDEEHAQKLQHNEEAHRTKVSIEQSKAAHDIANKDEATKKQLEMKEKSANADIKNKKTQSSAKGVGSKGGKKQ